MTSTTDSLHSMMDVDSLRTNLQAELAKTTIDHERVLELSSKLVDADSGHVRFSVDASHISRLGLELVGKQETAVAELVKNGYDADATKVELIFENVEDKGGTLHIVDNGHGMTRNQLIKGFMRISTSDKVESPRSPKYERQRAGRKGIGRFAAQRLGTRLTVATQTEDSDQALVLQIDWDDYTADKDLSTVSNRMKFADKWAPHGTRLTIGNLRDRWTEAEIRRSFRYIANLLQPFPLARHTRSDLEDPGFKAAFYKEENGQRQAIADEQSDILGHAVAVIEGRIDDNGRGYWSLTSRLYPEYDEAEKPLSSEKTGSENLFSAMQGTKVSFKAHFFLTAPDCVPKVAMGTVKTTLDRVGGIRLYRNGFRVLPYGEPGDDWLSIDKEHMVAKELPPVRNNRFIGFVEVADPDGICFEETSSREGLVENAAFGELSQFVSRALKSGIHVFREARKQEKEEKKQFEKANDPVEEVISIVDELRSQKITANAGFSSEKDLSARILDLGQTAQDLLEENALLRILSSMGLAIAEFTHEIRHILAAIFANMGRLEPFLSEHEKARDAVEGMKLGLASLKSYAHYFDEAISDNVYRELEPLELRDVVTAFIEVVRPVLERNKILLANPDIRGYDLFMRPMHKSEWASILFNLYTNSLKAIRRTGERGRLSINGGKDGEMVFLEFADNGDGIREEYKDRVFNAFFTTSTPPSMQATESEQLTGTGLGLKIVKDIVEALDGRITLVNPPAGYATCFRIEIPMATTEQIRGHDL